MIFMRMRHHDRIDAFESARPEEWRDDIFAHVEPRPHPAHIIGAGQTSGIHEHGATVGESHKNGVALPHVQDGHFEAPTLKSSGKRIDNDQRCAYEHKREPDAGGPFPVHHNRRP